MPDWLLRWDKDAARYWCGGAVFSSDGKRIFSAHKNLDDDRCWIIVWDTATGTVSSVLPVPAGIGSTAQALALAPDDRTLASCHKDGLRLWDVSEPALRQVREKLRQQDEDVKSGKVQAGTKPAAEPKAILHSHSDLITAITFHPDGKTLASASNDSTIKLWDVVTGETRLTLAGQMAGQTITNRTVTRPAALAFTPDGRTLMYGTNTGILNVWRGAAVPVRNSP